MFCKYKDYALKAQEKQDCAIRPTVFDAY